MQLSALSEHSKAQIIRNGKKGFSETTSTAENPRSAAAEQAHKRSQFVLNECGSAWPSLETIKKAAHSEWTILSVKHRIGELKRDHRQQLAKAMKYQSYEQAQAMVDASMSFDDTGSWSTNTREDAKNFFRMANHLHTHQSDDFISRLQYSHITALMPLYEKLQQLLAQEERARIQRARKFPKSSQGWREMDTPDAKLNVALFLLMDKRAQDDKLLREIEWQRDRADVDRVLLEFKMNVMFSEEVKIFVRKKSQPTDPRRRA